MYEGRFRAVRDTVEYPNGKVIAHETITHPGAVVILPVSNDGGLLLVEQYRHSIASMLLEFPAGTLEAGEEPRLCAERELAEEAGFAANEWISLGVLYPAPGFCDELQHLFLARGLSTSYAKPDDDEIITLHPMSIKDFEKAIASGLVNDAKSISIFFKARLLGLL